MKILGTIKRGKVKVKSPKQMRYLHWKGIDHTHFKYKDSKIIKKRHVYKLGQIIRSIPKKGKVK